MGKTFTDVNGHLIVRDSKGRFVSGRVANPSGAPRKGYTLTGMLRRIGYKTGENGKLNKELMAEKLWELAIDGSIPAARLILEYIDGKPVAKLDAALIPEKLMDVLINEVIVELPARGEDLETSHVLEDIVDVEAVSP